MLARMRIADLLRRDAGGSAAIRQAMERAEAAGREATARVDELTRQRAAALLADDDKALDRLEAELTRVRRDADRADLALITLEEQLGKAEEAERLAELDRTHAAGEAAQQRALHLIGEYGRLAGAMVPLLLELAARDREVAAANAALEDGHDPRRIQEPDALARPWRGMSTGRVELYRAVRLPDPADPAGTLYPPDTLREVTAVMAAAYDAGRRG
jgi:hypothetical protein